MINIFFDGVNSQYENAVTGYDLLRSLLQKSAANSVVAMKVAGIVSDLSCVIDSNAEIEFVRAEDALGLEIIRHDAAHIMAQAVKALFPHIQVTIGPTIKDGFFYDFATSEPFSIEHLELIEKKMQEIINQNHPFVREILPRSEAIERFRSLGENYKVEIIDSIPNNEALTIYHQGDFFDLCRGPHSPSTGRVKAFKLLKVAGAYWRGDSKNPMLQRIYGTAWHSKQELQNYLTRLEEAEKRDHRRIAKEMDLFHLQDEAQGQVFWHDKGWRLYRVIESYIRQKLADHGYLEVKTPVLVDSSLWEKSGHWEKFRENMFVSEAENKQLAIKPMNCPCHVQIFNTQTRSYAELPLRLAEFGLCHRNESSGSLHGLMRVRGFTQDDAHIFCTEDQITAETVAFCNLLIEVYKEFGFDEVSVKFSDRPEVRAGTDEVWDRAEKALTDAIGATGLPYVMNPGEGAFYGPKLEFVLKDAIGRDWQCGTLQIDFVLPERLKAFYIGSDGRKHHPVMLHRAIIGTFERFIGILIEHYAGKFPLWLAPVQIVVATITNDSNGYAEELVAILKKKQIRVEIDLTNEKIGYKIRGHSVRRVPVIWIVGKNEMLNKTVSVRKLGSQDQSSMSVDGAVSSLFSAIDSLHGV